MKNPFSQMARMAGSDRPILVGPWRSELGFEALYFIPWLKGLQKRWNIPNERLVVVTRGGAGAWYGQGVQAVELYDYLSVDRFRRAMLTDSATKGSVKQTTMPEWEKALLGLVASDLGIARYHTIHPSAMYNGFAPWWEGRQGLEWLVKQADFTPIIAPHMPLEIELPEKFAAVGFYARHTLPLQPQVIDFVQGLVARLAKKIPVVVVGGTGVKADEHLAFPVKGENVTRLPDLPTRDNLAIQSAVLAKAQAFVGTYGGLQQLATRIGKPSVGFFSEFGGTAYPHLILTNWLGMVTRVPTFVGRPEDANFILNVLG